MFKTSSSIWKIILVMTLFGWTSVARIARGAVMEAKNLEFNTASTALGSTPIRNLFRHILPNSLAPIIVVGTTSLATYIVLEATLSFLGRRPAHHHGQLGRRHLQRAVHPAY